MIARFLLSLALLLSLSSLSLATDGADHVWPRDGQASWQQPGLVPDGAHQLLAATGGSSVWGIDEPRFEYLRGERFSFVFRQRLPSVFLPVGRQSLLIPAPSLPPYSRNSALMRVGTVLLTV